MCSLKFNFKDIVAILRGANETAIPGAFKVSPFFLSRPYIVIKIPNRNY